MPKVAIITGGASGMGLAVATGLSQHQSEDWIVHILDTNSAQGNEVASGINATFHRCDVTDYNSLSTTFQTIYQQNKRIDFVHANAGISGPFDFLEACTTLSDDDDETSPPPPAPQTAVLDVNLKAVAVTSWLALHYFSRTKRGLGTGWEGNLIMTSSVAGLYAAYTLQLYAAAKAGVLGLTRSLGPGAYHKHCVRVNCILPGYVKTGMTAGVGIPEKFDTPIRHIVDAILMLIEGKSAVDSAGVKVEEGKMWGRAVEVARDDFHFKEMPPYTDEFMEELVGDSLGVTSK